jgi:hypothetical protein
MVEHDVVVLGFRLNGVEPPAKALERILRCTSEDARTLSKRFPVTVRSAVPSPEAEALASELRQAGARVEVRAVAQAPFPAEPSPAVSPAEPNHALAPSPAGVENHEARAPIVPPEPVGAASVAEVADDPAPADLTFKLGTLRIHVPAKARDSLPGRYLLGTLKIVLPAGGVPQPKATTPSTAPAVAAADGAAHGLYDTGLHDDVLDAPGAHVPLELDADALQTGARYVSGGRAGQRPSLMMRMRATIRRAPSNLVRPTRAHKRSGLPFRGLWRSPLMLPALFGALFMLVVHAALGSANDGEGARPDAVKGTAVGEHTEGASAPAAAAPENDAQAEESAPPLHPILRLAPKPMEAALASIMRKRVPGTHAVSIDWPEGQEPKESVQCMLVEGSTAQREQRVHALLATGKRMTLTPLIESQLRDHEEVLRIALGDANAHFSSLCLVN